MAGEIKASPRNQTLGKVADKLARLRDLANKYEILPQVPLLGGTGIGDLLMGEAPEEVSNWSYGNAPMQVPEMSNVPQMKTGRGQSVADTVFLGTDLGGLGTLATKLGARGISELAGSAGRALPLNLRGQIGAVGNNDSLPEGMSELLKRYKLSSSEPVQQSVKTLLDRSKDEVSNVIKSDLEKTNTAIQTHKEYPEAGYKWVQIKKPDDLGVKITQDAVVNEVDLDQLMDKAETLAVKYGFVPDSDEYESFIHDYISEDAYRPITVSEDVDESLKILKDALKYENFGRNMRFEEFSDLVADNKTQFFSLRDSENKPRVTIRTSTDPEGYKKPTHPKIIAIYGESWGTLPQEHIPLVQDFIKSNQWSSVSDLDKINMYDLNHQYSPNWISKDLGLDLGTYTDRFNKASTQSVDYPRFMSKEELQNFLGLDDPPQNFAQGGMVTPYDPARIEALVSQLMDEQ